VDLASLMIFDTAIFAPSLASQSVGAIYSSDISNARKDVLIRKAAYAVVPAKNTCLFKAHCPET